MELFSDMTVLENLLAASEKRDWRAYLSSFFWPGKVGLTDTGAAAVREFNLESVLGRRPSELPHGRQRMLAIARAVAAEPSVLLLDEPAAGLDEVESGELTRLIRRLASEWGMAVLLIEHDIPLVLAASDYIYTIEFGSLIAEGTPDETRMNPAVRRAYLGDEGHVEASAN
jgi:sulfate-transporting ATPase